MQALKEPPCGPGPGREKPVPLPPSEIKVGQWYIVLHFADFPSIGVAKLFSCTSGPGAKTPFALLLSGLSGQLTS